MPPVLQILYCFRSLCFKFTSLLPFNLKIKVSFEIPDVCLFDLSFFGVRCQLNPGVHTVESRILFVLFDNIMIVLKVPDFTHQFGCFFLLLLNVKGKQDGLLNMVLFQFGFHLLIGKSGRSSLQIVRGLLFDQRLGLIVGLEEGIVRKEVPIVGVDSL